MTQRGRPKGSVSPDTRRHRITVRLDDDDFELLRLLAESTGQAPVEVMRLGLQIAAQMASGDGYDVKLIAKDDAASRKDPGFYYIGPRAKKPLALTYHGVDRTS